MVLKLKNDCDSIVAGVRHSCVFKARVIIVISDSSFSLIIINLYDNPRLLVRLALI